MKNIISKFLDKKCKVDLDLLIDLQCKGHLAKKFYKYIVLDNVTEEVWISKKDSKFLVEFRDSDYSFYLFPKEDSLLNVVDGGWISYFEFNIELFLNYFNFFSEITLYFFR